MAACPAGRHPDSGYAHTVRQRIGAAVLRLPGGRRRVPGEPLFGFGTNSTPNHLLIVGGQSPTLRNPPQSGAQPEWDMPSLPGHAQDHGLTWKVYAGSSGYPVSFYTQLKGSANIVGSDQIVADAQAGALPALAMVWHDSPYDEHPVADVSLGQGKVWQAVDAIVAA